MPIPRNDDDTPYLGGRTDSGRSGRAALEVPVQLRAGGAVCAGVTKNIGSGGVFVATARPLSVGERVNVTLKMKGDPEPVEALAEVRWCRPFEELDDRLPPGVGLRFIDTPLRAAILTNELWRSRG
jgi:uncharacterized protein (TIGR02266 family)